MPLYLKHVALYLIQVALYLIQVHTVFTETFTLHSQTHTPQKHTMELLKQKSRRDMPSSDEGDGSMWWSAQELLKEMRGSGGWDVGKLSSHPGFQTVKLTGAMRVEVYDGSDLIGEVVVQPKTKVAIDAIKLANFNMETRSRDIKGRTVLKTRHDKPVVGNLFSHGTLNMQSEEGNRNGYLTCYQPLAQRDPTLEEGCLLGRRRDAFPRSRALPSGV